jgi:pilus assembly protein CpaB
MKASRYIVIAVAGVTAILLAFLAQSLLSPKKSADPGPSQVTVKAEAPPPTVKVLVAARELAVGTRLTEEDLMWLDWPLSAKSDAYRIKPETTNAIPVVQPTPTDDKTKAAAQNAVKNASEVGNNLLNPTGGMEDLLGATVREVIQAREPIVATKVVRANESGYLAVTLDPGMRAMAVPISVESTAGGFILPGDHVDIMVSHQVPRPGGKSGDERVFIAETVLHNIKVLAIDQSLDVKKDQQAALGATATLAVTPAQTQTLALAKSVGTLSLLLRSYADMGSPSGNSPPDQTGQGQGDTRRNLVRVFRGDNSNDATEVMVSR